MTLDWSRVGAVGRRAAGRRPGLRRARRRAGRAGARGARRVAAGDPAGAADRLPGARALRRGGRRASTTRSAWSRRCSRSAPRWRRSTPRSTTPAAWAARWRTSRRSSLGWCVVARWRSAAIRLEVRAATFASGARPRPSAHPPRRRAHGDPPARARRRHGVRGGGDRQPGAHRRRGSRSTPRRTTRGPASWRRCSATSRPGSWAPATRSRCSTASTATRSSGGSRSATSCAARGATRRWATGSPPRSAGAATRRRAARLICEFAFDHAGLHRVQPAVIPRNIRSIRVVEKAGFRQRGPRAAVPQHRRALGGPRHLRDDARGLGGAHARGEATGFGG